MRKLARENATALLDRFTRNLARVAEGGDADSIHDLRVSIRRLRACLRVFRDSFPRKTRKRIDTRLAPLMKAAGSVRDRDVALELLAQSGVAASSPTLRRLASERAELVATLARRAATLAERGAARKWAGALGV